MPSEVVLYTYSIDVPHGDKDTVSLEAPGGGKQDPGVPEYFILYRNLVAGMNWTVHFRRIKRHSFSRKQVP